MGRYLEIKVCGLHTLEAARAAARGGADWLGLVLAPSPRRIAPPEARALIEGVAGRWVGVFVDEHPAAVARLCRELGLSAVQLHGAETPADCRSLRDAIGVEVWKALRAPRAVDDAWWEAADRILLDTGAGTGRPLPWDEITLPDERPLPVFLAGGLAADNVAHAIAALRPDGVDASSRLERAPGVKDPGMIRAFVAAARQAARSIPAPSR